MNRELDADHARFVRESFARQSFMATLGAEIESLAPGEVAIRFSHRPDLLQQHGYLHAGVATAIVDSACGYAALSLAPSGCEVLTVEFKCSFFRPASGQEFRANGAVVKAGRRIMFCEGEVIEVASEPRAIARMSTSVMVLAPN